MRPVRRRKLSLEQKRSVNGYVFTLPFTIGFGLFFLYPFIQSVIFSFSHIKITPTGFALDRVGLANYSQALFVDTNFVKTLIQTVRNMVSDVPLVLVFSFFVAILLNQEFRGRGLARVIFFLPVILGAGVVFRIEQSDYFYGRIQDAATTSGGFLSGGAIQGLLAQLRLPPQLLNYILPAIDDIPTIIRASGIQILIFLAGLKTIPSALYEAADVEGATGWERFWLITLPLMSPLVLTNVVYSIIDSFTAGDNALISLLQQTTFGGAGYGVSTAMAWLYFLAVSAILSVIVGIISKRVFYQQ